MEASTSTSPPSQPPPTSIAGANGTSVSQLVAAPPTFAAAAAPTSSSIDPIQDVLTAEYPDLASLTQEDLQRLLTDETLYDAYFNTTPHALEQHRILEQAMSANVALAQKNEDLRPQLEALRQETLTQFNEAVELRSRWAHLETAQAEYYRRFTPQAQLSRLAAATSSQEYMSEHLVNAFLDGEIDDETFVKQYKGIRQIYHRRAVSLNKWQDGKVVWR